MRKNETKPKKAFEYCLKLLSKQDYSAVRLREKLEKNGYSEKEAEDAINILKDRRYIDEERMASNIIRKYTVDNPVSLNLIALKMEEKGINQSVYSKMLSEINDSDLAVKAAELRKKAKPKDKKSFSDESYWYKYLGSKGFEYDIIDGIINKIKEESE